jgi:hypothetical protein
MVVNRPGQHLSLPPAKDRRWCGIQGNRTTARVSREEDSSHRSSSEPDAQTQTYQGRDFIRGGAAVIPVRVSLLYGKPQRLGRNMTRKLEGDGGTGHPISRLNSSRVDQRIRPEGSRYVTGDASICIKQQLLSPQGWCTFTGS